MKFEDRLAQLRCIEIPIWLIDYVGQKMIWGNPRAIELWNAQSLEDLLQRDFTKTSDAIRLRQNATQALIEAGGSETRLITFYPQNLKVVTVRCHLSGFKLDDGRVVTLTQALDTEVAIDSEQLRGIDAIRRIGAMVILLDNSGAVLMQNPAAIGVFGIGASVVNGIVDKTMARDFRDAISACQPFRDEVLVETTSGRRWHLLDGHRSLDPVTGKEAYLLIQMDVTESRELRDTLKQKERQIQALSVPILQVGAKVLALPVVGDLDEARGSMIASRLLDQVVARAASTVIVDLTGVDSLDVVGADSLMKLARALQLLGVRPIFAGIKEGLAATLVATGADFRGVLTVSTLREGLSRSRMN